MLRYFYAWTPLAIVGTVVILSLPWLGLIALMVFSLLAVVALAAFAWAIVLVPSMLVRTIGRPWHVPVGASPRMAAALSPAETNTVAMLVRDDSTNDHFELLVDPGTNPIDVYEHPYAAAWRGIDYRSTDLRHVV